MSFYLNINVNGFAQDEPEFDALLAELSAVSNKFKALAKRTPGSLVEGKINITYGSITVGQEDNAEDVELTPASMEEIVDDYFALQDARVKDKGRRCPCRMCTVGWEVRDAYDAGKITKLEAFGCVLELKREALGPTPELPEAFLDQVRGAFEQAMAAQYN